MHSQLCIGPDGLETLWPGLQSPETFIADWIRHPGMTRKVSHSQVDAGHRDLQATLQRNRDTHYGRCVHSIMELRSSLQGRPFVIVCPGPSLAETDLSLIPESAVVVCLNRAIRYRRPTVAFVTERHALLDWTQDDMGVLLPYIPDVPLVTSFDASDWLADLWPDDKRFYAVLPWGEVPQDARAQPYIDAGNELFSCMFTPVMAMDFARKMGASQIVLVGADFAMTPEGLYYPDMPASEHCNRHDMNAMLVPDIRGGMCATNPMLMYARNVVEAVAYWIMRTARIPVLNCSAGGIFDWAYCPTLDQVFPLEPDNEPTAASSLGEPAETVHGQMERPQLQAA